MKLFHRIIFLLLLSFSANNFADSMNNSSSNILEQMFTWWNGVMSSERELKAEDFAHFYTEDAAIVINGVERVKGVVMMPGFFKENRDRTEFIEIEMPFKEKFRSGDKIFTYHTIRAIRNGIEEVSHNMGYAIIKNDKIAYVSLARFTMD